MKKILIATPHLNSGGVEVSLIRFIKELSKNKNLNIDLLLLDKNGMYLKEIPSNINIEEIKYDNQMYSYNWTIKDYKQINNLKDKFKFLKYRIKLKYYLMTKNWEKYYKEFLKHTKKIDEEYDLAIDWHGYGHFITTIIAEKVVSKKKAMWIHDEKNEWINKINCWLNNFDKIFCVSKACKNTIEKKIPKLKNKLDIFYNMTDYKNIRNKAKDKINFNFNENVTNIITVGRLEWQKGYDITVKIARELKEKKFKFCWYIIGDGSKKEEIKTYINENKLNNEIKLLGIIKNPFPYIKKADLYVLNSRHEGYCQATLEAKILEKIIIVTDIESNREQITNNKNGILCKLDYKLFAEKIIEISNNTKLKNTIKNNLTKENFDRTEQFKKLYKLMED